MAIHADQVRAVSIAALRDARDDGHAFCVWSRTRYSDYDPDAGRILHYHVIDWITWCDGEPCARGHLLIAA